MCNKLRIKLSPNIGFSQYIIAVSIPRLGQKLVPINLRGALQCEWRDRGFDQQDCPDKIEDRKNMVPLKVLIWGFRVIHAMTAVISTLIQFT